MRYTFRPFTEADFPQMHRAFLTAFSGYPLPFNLSYQEFIQKFVYKLNINLALSVGAFDHKELVGFIFTGIEDYRGMKTAYNGGTGVVPDHRGRRLTLKMYDYLWPILEKEAVKQAVLEVLTTNEKAIKSYQQAGFEVHALFHCYQFKRKKIPDSERPDIAVEKKETADWPLYKTFFDGTPSYLDTIRVLAHNLAREHIAEAIIENETVGYIIFQPQVSRISQLAVKKEFRRNGIGTKLLNYALKHTASKAITVINVDDREKVIMAVLKKWGFESTVDQYEMVKMIGH